ncbi:MAG: undecaprenyldiphospho-muramoylpentapeptide beta-N-acetylglucosaminyltransferase [Cyanobacteria bacterium P01_D01_bin.128]
MGPQIPKLLIAASGTGGHLFPAIATAQHLPGYTIEWLGVPNRLETQLVPADYPLHTVSLGGFQGPMGLGSARLMVQLTKAVFQVRQLLKQNQFHGVFTTGGYIAAPAILAARSLGLPTVLHESNALPGKVTRWLSPWCTAVALGFEDAALRLPKANRRVSVGTPVRSQFLSPAIPTVPSEAGDSNKAGDPETAGSIELPKIPADAKVILVIGGSQGAVAVNKLVRAAAPAWIAAGAWIIHQTGENDPNADSFSHPHYIHQPFFNAVAPLLQRADLAVSRAGAGTLTELAVTRTPAILIPYPFAAEDHQSYNAAVFAAAGAASVCSQADLEGEQLQTKVLALLSDRAKRQAMADAAGALAILDSAERLASLIQGTVEPRAKPLDT